MSRNRTIGNGLGPPGCGGTATAAPPDQVITSWGAFAPLSRDESARAVLLVVESPKLTSPLPVTAEVTSTLVQVLAATFPELPSLAPKGGAFA